MFGFIKELSQISGVPFDSISGSFNINWLGEIVYVNNFIKILAYSSESVALKVKNNVINVNGQNLVIAQLSPKEIVLKGEITSVNLDKPVKPYKEIK